MTDRYFKTGDKIDEYTAMWSSASRLLDDPTKDAQAKQADVPWPASFQLGPPPRGWQGWRSTWPRAGAPLRGLGDAANEVTTEWLVARLARAGYGTPTSVAEINAAGTAFAAARGLAWDATSSRSGWWQMGDALYAALDRASSGGAGLFLLAAAVVGGVVLWKRRMKKGRR